MSRKSPGESLELVKYSWHQAQPLRSAPPKASDVFWCPCWVPMDPAVASHRFRGTRGCFGWPYLLRQWAWIHRECIFMYFPYICLRGGPKICRKKLRSSMSSMGSTCVQPLNHPIYHEGYGKGHPNSWVSLRPEELTKYHGWSTYPTINADYISLLKKHHIKVQQGYPGKKKGHLKYNGYPPNFGKKKQKHPESSQDLLLAKG